jgi:hypothetical protein
MSFALTKKGSPSPSVGIGNVGTPTAVQLTANGMRGFLRCKDVNAYTFYSFTTVYKGRIRATDWDGSAWSSLVPGLGGDTPVTGAYDEGVGLLEISANGASVAWDFKFFTPDTTGYYGISVSGTSPINYLPFIAANPSSPSSQTGTSISPAANNPNSPSAYTPKSILFSDNGALGFVYYSGPGGNLIEINAGISGTRTSLWFPTNGPYGNNYRGFEISVDGNHVFVLIGGSIKLFSWNGSAYAFSYEFSASLTSNSSTFSVNFDGSVIAIQNAGVKIYKKTGSTWAQLGGDLTDGSARLNSSGTLVTINQISSRALYSWDGTVWDFVRFTPVSYLWIGNPISDNGETAIAPSSAGSIQRYEIQDVPPLYKGSSIATAIYAGSTPATAVYYGAQKLWPTV